MVIYLQTAFTKSIFQTKKRKYANIPANRFTTVNNSGCNVKFLGWPHILIIVGLEQKLNKKKHN